MLCRELGFWHPAELRATLPHEWLSDWKEAYLAEPWGESRADNRQAAGIMWLLRPNMSDTDEEFELPALHGPDYFPTERSETDKLRQSMSRIEALKERYTRRVLDQKTQQKKESTDGK